jgi:hypothetical protein
MKIRKINIGKKEKKEIIKNLKLRFIHVLFRMLQGWKLVNRKSVVL